MRVLGRFRVWTGLRVWFGEMVGSTVLHPEQVLLERFADEWRQIEVSTIQSPPTVLCDNVSTPQIAHNQIFHKRTRYIEIDYYFIQELLA